MKKTIMALAAGMLLLGSALPALAATTQANASMIGQLHAGSRGDAVKLLQALLAADPAVYPEGTVSGYYGKLTAAAVARFQKKHGLDTVGNVGPKTLAKLNDELASTTVGLEDQGGVKVACAIVPPGHLIAPGWLKKNGNVAPTVPACQTLPPGILGHIGSSTTPTTTPPVITDTTAPVLSGLAVTGVASTSAIISWNTNEAATGKVYFGTTAPLVLTSTAFVATSTLATTHSFTVSGLATSTLYNFVVESKDAANNTATSSQMSFTTLAL
jgi:peptidoglycan hydrolase-like protein with peptidoglycan-binding domain